jgi:hypothetical protein
VFCDSASPDRMSVVLDTSSLLMYRRHYLRVSTTHILLRGEKSAVIRSYLSRLIMEGPKSICNKEERGFRLSGVARCSAIVADLMKALVLFCDLTSKGAEAGVHRIQRDCDRIPTTNTRRVGHIVIYSMSVKERGPDTE